MSKTHVSSLRPSRTCVLLAAGMLFALGLSPVSPAQTGPTRFYNPQDDARIISGIIDLYGPESTGQARVVRQFIANSLDTVFAVPANPALHPLLDPARADFIAEFFAYRMRRGINRIAVEPPPSNGARVYKLYSSSFVVKTSQVTAGFDIAFGPFGLLGLTTVTPADIATLAGALDVYFISHLHGDHFDVALCEAMLNLGKTVVATAELQCVLLANGFSWASGITVPTPGVAQTIGGASFQTFFGHQYLGFLNGHLKTPDPTLFAPVNQVYRLITGGRGFLHCGDNNDLDILDWLPQVAPNGAGIDVMLQATLKDDLLYLTDPDLIFLAHEWEFTHFGGGFGLLAMPSTITPLRRVLIWGESVDYQP